MSQNTKVVTGVKTRLSYANVWAPKSINGGKEKYSVSLIIPKSDKKKITAIEKAVNAAIQEGIGKFGGKKPNRRHSNCHFAMEILNVTMRLTKTATSLTPTPSPHHRLLTSTSNQFSTKTKSTVSATPEFPLTSTLLIPMVIAEWLVDSPISKRSAMINRSVVMPVPVMTSRPLTMMAMMIS